MLRFIDKASLPDGGAPIEYDQVSDILQDAIYEAILASTFGAREFSTAPDRIQEGLWLSEALPAYDGADWTWGASRVFIDGHYRTLPAGSLTAGATVYVVAASDVITQKTFEDGASKNLIIDRRAEVTASDPGSTPNKITLKADTTTLRMINNPMARQYISLPGTLSTTGIDVSGATGQVAWNYDFWGRKVHFSISLDGGTISATGETIEIDLPNFIPAITSNGYPNSVDVFLTAGEYLENTTNALCGCYLDKSNRKLIFRKDGRGNWAGGAVAFDLYCSGDFLVERGPYTA